MFGRKGKKDEHPLEIASTVSVEAVEEVQKPRKYELLPAENVTNREGYTYPMHRIRALVDIPMHGVKAGDLGGFIYNEDSLSHNGSCWVGGNAIVASFSKYSNMGVTGDALVTDNAYVNAKIGGRAKISGNADVQIEIGGESEISGDCTIISGYVRGTIILKGAVKVVSGQFYVHPKSSVVLDGDIVLDNEKREEAFVKTGEGDNVSIKGKVILGNVDIKGSCTIDADVNLESVSFKGNTTILGKPQIKPNVKFTGVNFISGDSLIPPGSNVHDVRMTGGFLSYGVPAGASMPLQEATSSAMPELEVVSVSESASEAQEYVDLINQIESDYEAYTTDIVKLIKYPAMVDASIPEVIDFISKLRAAKRGLVSSKTSRLKVLAEELDTAFIRAENKVRTLVASHLDENKKKSLKTAEQMFKLACDESSPEPEKKLGFKAGMRSLEGIVDVSDKAVENMKVRIGILELEA